MAQSLTSLAAVAGAEPRPTVRHKLDELDPRLARHLVVFNPDAAVAADLMEKARRVLPGLADTAEVLKVLRHNPTCFFAAERKSRFDPSKPTAGGCIFTLPLNQHGVDLLALDMFNAAQPDLRLLAKQDERPAGIYIWWVFLPGTLSAVLPLFMDRLALEPYAGVNIYGRPVTDDGRRYGWEIGMTRGTRIGDIDAPNVWVFPRTVPVPLYDSYVPGAAPGTIGVTIARTMEDLARVITIRSAVYIGEQECPYEGRV